MAWKKTGMALSSINQYMDMWKEEGIDNIGEAINRIISEMNLISIYIKAGIKFNPKFQKTPFYNCKYVFWDFLHILCNPCDGIPADYPYKENLLHIQEVNGKYLCAFEYQIGNETHEFTILLHKDIIKYYEFDISNIEISDKRYKDIPDITYDDIPDVWWAWQMLIYFIDEQNWFFLSWLDDVYATELLKSIHKSTLDTRILFTDTNLVFKMFRIFNVCVLYKEGNDIKCIHTNTRDLRCKLNIKEFEKAELLPKKSELNESKYHMVPLFNAYDYTDYPKHFVDAIKELHT